MTDHGATPAGAAEWFLAIYAAERPSQELLQAWLSWMEAAEQNRQAFEEIVQIWHNTPTAVITRRAKLADEDEYDGSVSIAQWQVRRQTARLEVASRPTIVTRHRSFLAVAAALALVVTVGLSFRIFAPGAISAGEFATRTGQQLQLHLADDSHVTLGPHSTLAIDLRSDVRQVNLESGEAYFSVHKDPNRPFTVRAFNGVITAVGTAFNVRAIKDRVTVTVTEGSVKVSDLRAPTSQADLLVRGDQLTFTQGKMPILQASAVKQIDVKEFGRRRDGWLIYRDEPLQYVVADITRYTNTKVTVSASAADVHFSGAVFKDNIDEWLAALPEVVHVSVKNDGHGFEISSGQKIGE